MSSPLFYNDLLLAVPRYFTQIFPELRATVEVGLNLN